MDNKQMKWNLTPTLLMVSLVAIGLLAGCAKKPIEAWEDIQSYVSNGEEAEFLKCFEGTEQQIDLLSRMFRYLSARRKFTDAMIESYGAESLKGYDPLLPLEQAMFDPDWKATSVLSSDKKEATISGPGLKSNPIKMVLRDGLWMVVAKGLLEFPTEGDVQKAKVMYDLKAAVLIDEMEAIGEEGYTAKVILEEVHADFLRRILSLPNWKQ